MHRVRYKLPFVFLLVLAWTVLLPAGTSATGFTFTLSDADSVRAPESAPEMYIHGTLHNTTDSLIIIDILRIEQVLPHGWASSMCLDACYPPEVDSVDLYLPAGASQSFTFYFYPAGKSAFGEATILFRDRGNPTAQISRRLTGKTFGGLTSVDNPASPVATKLRFAPHPVQNQATLRLGDFGLLDSGPFTVQFFAPGGNRVREINTTDSTIFLHRAGMPGGVYFFYVLGAYRIPIGQGKLILHP